jgi:hypothetical protein
VKIDIAKDDILTLRTEMYDQLRRLKRSPAYSKPEFEECVVPQARVLAKFIRKLNRACVQAFGHDCHADGYDTTVK